MAFQESHAGEVPHPAEIGRTGAEPETHYDRWHQDHALQLLERGATADETAAELCITVDLMREWYRRDRAWANDYRRRVLSQDPAALALRRSLRRDGLTAELRGRLHELELDTLICLMTQTRDPRAQTRALELCMERSGGPQIPQLPGGPTVVDEQGNQVTDRRAFIESLTPEQREQRRQQVVAQLRAQRKG